MSADAARAANADPWEISCLPGLLLTFLVAFLLRLLEWQSWQNPEYRFGNEMLLATHDAYHWVAGACGFGRAAGHPMADMLAAFSAITGFSPARIAFWLPPIFSSCAAAAVFLWAFAMGGARAGIAAGIIASISPGFLGRTLLGFYDTDLVTLLFPLAVSLPPAVWLSRHVGGIPDLLPKLHKKKEIACAMPENVLEISGAQTAILAFAGLMAWWTQAWHSVFPYLVRYFVLVIFAMALCLGKKGQRAGLLLAGLCFAFPCAAGPAGLAWPAFLYGAAHCPPGYKKIIWRVIFSKWFVACLWLAVLGLLAKGQIWDTLVSQINAYLKHAGDTHSSGQASLVFPSVAQSIIEVQDLSFTALFPYFHPWLEAALLGFCGYAVVVWKRPAAIFLLPLAALGLASARLGGRMVMFGAPIMALGFCLPFYWILRNLTRKWLSRKLCGWISCIALCAILVAPFIEMIPAMSQGPILNRRHAAALAQAGVITPPDATLWLWWDWGYAAHYFARRQTIADGAMHGGPSLYLPATVFATDNPRFARQVIRRASTFGNNPGEFFKDLDAVKAQSLIDRLHSSKEPLIRGAGRQYLVVSFEMLKLGFWISNFGNWNFVTCAGDGGALSIVTEGLSYRLDAGEVRLDGRQGIILPSSITIFAETGVIGRDYIRDWFARHPEATEAEKKAWLASRRNINFLFNKVTDEKLAVDQGLYDSLMIQLLVCDAHDPRFTPYFRLVYDNIFARIYEVLPAVGD